jgi:nitroreductase
MDLYEAIEKRKTIRRFDKSPIPDEIVRRIINAGLKAPAGTHVRDWHFILLKDTSVCQEMVRIDEVEDVSPDVYKQRTKCTGSPITFEMYVDANAVQKSMSLLAPEVMVVCYKKNKEVKDFTHINDLNRTASIWCCIENMLLAMSAEGIFGVTRIPHNIDGIRSLLDIPNDYEIATIISFGYPANNAVRCEQNPINLDEHVHINKFHR